MTKPFQGGLFRKFRYQIMGVILDQYPVPGKSQPGSHRQERHSQEKSIQIKARNIYFKSLVLPVGQHHRSVLGEIKNGQNGQMHAHAIF